MSIDQIMLLKFLNGVSKSINAFNKKFK